MPQEDYGNGMTTMHDSTVRDADALRKAMVAALRDQDAITSEPVAAAFASVPRHLFAPDAPLEDAYNLHGIVVAKKDEQGLNTSVMSAPHLQAVMLEQAEIKPGMKVLEIGSGGYNAALAAELVGTGGTVTTIDIDADITDRASACLDAAGYGGRVRVVLADGEDGVPDGAPYDRIIVTAAAWDIPPAWIRDLAEQGRIVVPLAMRGTVRSIAFDCEGDDLISRSYRLAHFVPMQGVGAAVERQILVREGIALRTDDPAVDLDPVALDQALESPQLVRWSGAAYDLPDELDLYLTLNLSQAARLQAAKEVVETGLVGRSARLGVPALVREGSFAYRIRRENHEDASLGGFESGVISHGPQAEALAEEYLDLLRRWAGNHRRRGTATFRYRPGETPASTPVPQGAVTRRHGILTVSWH